MEGNIAATYTLVYHFLKQHSQNKAAEAVKKAAKGFVILHEDVEQEGPSLEDIIKEWRTRRCTKSGKGADLSSEESESSDGASSDSEDSSSSGSSSEDTSGSESEDDDTSDSDDSHGSNEEATIKKSPLKGIERDTSVTLSSTGENARELAKQVTKIPEKESTKDKNKSSESDSSELDSLDSDSSNSDSPSECTALRDSDPKTSSSSDSSSGSDSRDEDEANAANEKAPLHTTKITENKTSGSSESSLDSDDESDSESQQSEDARALKKRKTSEGGTAVATAISTKSQQTEKASQKKEKTPPKVRERFQRVKVQKLEPELLLNNGYEARGGAVNDYGERAHRDLIVTRGAGFRKEKNKKKRGSYRGGEITMENHSIKFDF